MLIPLKFVGLFVCFWSSSVSTAKRSYPTSEVRGCGREELPNIQGAAAAWAQEDQEELLHVQGQEGQP